MAKTIKESNNYIVIDDEGTSGLLVFPKTSVYSETSISFNIRVEPRSEVFEIQFSRASDWKTDDSGTTAFTTETLREFLQTNTWGKIRNRAQSYILLKALKLRATYYENATLTTTLLDDLDDVDLLEKASIITTPTAYSDGVLHSVKPSESPYADFTFTRNDAGTRVNASGNVESIGVDLPRIDYRGGNGSLLLEPQATNTATDSNDFSQGSIFVSSSNPSLTSATLTSAQATSPDGTNNAWKLVDNNDANTGQCSLNYFTTTVISEDYNTLSLFVKKQGNNDWMYINNFGFDVGGRSWFNISNGTLGTVASGHTASIDDYGNGWYRIAVTFTTEFDLNGFLNIRLATSDGATSILRDGTNGVYIYGLQAESHATRQYATSYIPTSGSPQTRGEDLAASAGSSDLISSTEGVLYAEISALTNEDSTYRVIALSNGIVDEYVLLGFNTTNQIYSSVGGQFITSYTPTDATDFHKVAIKYEDNNSKLFINGVQVGTINTTATVPSGLDRLNFGVGIGKFEGNVKCVAVFKEALTDAELTCLTTI